MKDVLVRQLYEETLEVWADLDRPEDVFNHIDGIDYWDKIRQSKYLVNIDPRYSFKEVAKAIRAKIEEVNNIDVELEQKGSPFTVQWSNRKREIIIDCVTEEGTYRANSPFSTPYSFQEWLNDMVDKVLSEHNSEWENIVDYWKERAKSYRKALVYIAEVPGYCGGTMKETAQDVLEKFNEC